MPPDAPSTAESRRAARLFSEIQSKSPGWVFSAANVEKLPEAQELFGGAPPLKVAFVRHTIDKIGCFRETIGEPTNNDQRLHAYWNLRHRNDYPHAAVAIAAGLLRQSRLYTEEDLAFLVRRTAHLGIVVEFNCSFVGALVRLAERQSKSATLGAELKSALGLLSAALARSDRAAEQKLVKSIATLRTGMTQLTLKGGEAWADQAVKDIEAREQQKSNWSKLFALCESAAGGSPSAKWLKSAGQLISDIGETQFRSRVLSWFPLVDKPRSTEVASGWSWAGDPGAYIDPSNADALRGLTWCCSRFDDPELARAVGALAISAYRKIPNVGPRLVKLGNACVWTLGNSPGMNGVFQLAILKTRVKFGTAQKLIEKALAAAAERAGLPRDEIEELAVPTYGLDGVGRRGETIGEYTANLVVGDENTVDIRWRKPDGKPLKSAPAAVKKEQAAELKELMQAAKDIQAMLPAQRERIDALHLARKSWPLATWCERYRDHPFVGTIARRLIWCFSDGESRADGIWLDGSVVDVQGRPLALADTAMRSAANAVQVELWHPIGKAVAEVIAWRRFLERHEIRQPFKQAHREVYLLTDAERATRTYSNRFAAHIVRQHQFNALCGARGWRNKLRLMVDAEYPPATRELPQWGLRAEFWIEGIGTEWGVDLAESGAYLRLATDQVRFYRLEATQLQAHAGGGGYQPGYAQTAADPLQLDQIPPLVLSEIMRDVDLFVGVASVGNDPTWQDGGPDGRFVDYWSRYAFGDIAESAKTRKQVLERLIPRLAIADRCSFTENFLVVRGDLRTYKLHLGSANILMEPNDQYLCIVASRRSGSTPPGERVFLPFEGDERLAIIISKALMLAADTQIKDESITRQIRAAAH